MGKLSQLLYRHAALWLVPLSVVVGLLLGEAALRLFPGLLTQEAQIKRLWMLQTHAVTVADPYLGFLYPPYYRKEIVSLDFRFDIQSDGHGFRNDSPWPEQADIVVVGDSMAYGWGVAQDASWISLLGMQMPGMRVITLGMPGTVPQQYYRYFERFGIGLRPKVLIFGIFAGNDLVDAETFNRWVAAGSPGNYDVWRFFEGRVPKPNNSFPKNVQVLLLAESVKKSLSQSYSSMTIETADGESLQLAPAIYRRALEHNNPGNSGFRSVVQAALDARNLARDNGSEFLAILFPTKEEIYLPLYGELFPSLTQHLKEALGNEGVALIDMSDRFRELAVQGHKLYFKIDGHPNEFGNRVIADVVADYLRKN